MIMMRASDTHLRTTAFQHRRVVDLFLSATRLKVRAVCSVEQHVLRLLQRNISHCHIYIVNIIYSNEIMKQTKMA